MSTVFGTATSSGIIYEYEDGGQYCGEWDNDQAHGYGVCTGPEGKGLFEGLWVRGNQASGVFTWPTGQRYTGTWEEGARAGTGQETKPGGTEYSGEFTRDARGAHGVLRLPNGAVYIGTWSDGVQDGEGLETYEDGGVYRGQYKRGVRHGYGTRSSSAYELGERKHRTSDPDTGIGLAKKASQISIISGSYSFTKSKSKADVESSVTSDQNSQIYEGEWKDDKRHGYGVLKVCGHYTYYGEWENNVRTGYGVLVHSNGRKEAGQWQKGRLISVLRKKKLTVAYLKGHGMEGKVNQARTLALQAADTARNKAMLAESKAQLSKAKDSTAQKTAQQSLKDAQIARGKAELHRNAPRVAEGLKSPMNEVTLEFPAIDIQGPKVRSKSEASSTDSGFLTVGKIIHPTPSYEDIFKHEEMPSEDSDSESNGSTDPISRGASVASNLSQSQQWRDTDAPNRNPHNRRAWYQHQHQHRPHSAGASKSSLEHRLEHDSFESTTSMPNPLLEDEAERLLEKRRRFAQISEPDHTFDKHMGHGEQTVRKQNQRLSRRASDNTPDKAHTALFRMRSRSLSDPDEDFVEARERHGEVCLRESVASGSRRVRRRKSSPTRDKTTGEIGHGDATDDELLKEDHNPVTPEPVGQRSKSTLPLPRPLVKKSSITMDMLTQMANWNKMVAYINFALLIFLLLLIIVVVLGMNYYYLSHNMGVPQQSPGFLTPMA